jgi:hypothetical protein
MALIKKIDVEKHFAARRAMRLGRIGLMRQPVAAATEPAAKKKIAPASAESLASGQASPIIASASIPIMYDSGRNRLLRPPGSRQE